MWTVRPCRSILTRPASKLSSRVGEKARGPSLRRCKWAGRWRRDVVARSGQPDPAGMRVYRWPRSAEFLLMAKQAAFDTSWMNLGAEAFLDPLHQVRQSNGRFFLAHLANECEDLLGELVCLLGTALVWHQAGKTVVLESRLCLIERRPRKAE